jgi:hypothetical protein
VNIPKAWNCFLRQDYSLYPGCTAASGLRRIQREMFFERSVRKNCRQAKGFMHAAKAGFFNSSTAPYFLWIFWKFILDG